MWRAALRMPVARPAAALKTQCERIASCVEWRFAGDSEHLRNLPNYYSKQNVVSYMLEKNGRNWTIFCRLHGMVDVSVPTTLRLWTEYGSSWYWPVCIGDCSKTILHRSVARLVGRWGHYREGAVQFWGNSENICSFTWGGWSWDF